MNQELQKKYPHLEINVLSLSQVYNDNESRRIDAEYYKGEFFKNEKLIGENFVHLSSISGKICSGSTPPNGHFYTEGIPFFRSQDFNILEAKPKQYIDKKFHNILERSQVKNGDILIAIVGATLGQVGIANKIYEANINQNVARIRIVDKEFDPYFIAIFLSSYYGQYQISRLATRTAQEFLNNTLLGKLKIPKIPMVFQLKIRELIFKSYIVLEQSKALYKEAQDILYIELGLDPNNPLGEFEEEGLNISIQTLQESYMQTGRLDAEYYQKKYTKNIKIIKKGKYAKLNELVWIKKSIEPGSKAYKKSGIPFCRVSNLSVYDVGGYDVFLDREEFLDTLEELCPSRDTILFSKDGSVGIAYCVKNSEEIITSSGILHLSIKDKKVVLPEYLCLVLNSIVVKLQAQRDCGGSVIEHWRTEEVKNTLIPILSENQQNLINQKITQSFDLRIKAKNLLKEAIAQVEAKISARV